MGVIKSIVELASLADLKAQEAWALGSGTPAKHWGLKGQGTIEMGAVADLVIMDAPLGSVATNALESIELGDIPGITGVLIDGRVWAMKSRNTPAATRFCEWERVGSGDSQSVADHLGW